MRKMVRMARDAYIASAILTFSTVLLFLLANLVAGWIASTAGRDRMADLPLFLRHASAQDLAWAYPGMSAEEIRDLLYETWSRKYSYEPFTQFKESAHKGRYVNVSPDGFRHGAVPSPWPPAEGSIFVFGGSTTFGYGVPDWQTVPSHLQRALRERGHDRVTVYNFGRGHYYSTQEVELAERLLRAGHRPDAMLFIDGLNDFSHHLDQPLFAQRLHSFIAGEGVLQSAVSGLPLARLARSFRRGQVRPIQEITRRWDEAQFRDEIVLSQRIARYRFNKKLIRTIAHSLGIPVYFVWQPVPTYRYPIEQHRFARFLPDRQFYSRHGFERMRTLFEENQLGDDFLWCADLQDGVLEPLYVDAVHYSDAMARRLAEAIAASLLGHDSGCRGRAYKPEIAAGRQAREPASSAFGATGRADESMY